MRKFLFILFIPFLLGAASQDFNATTSRENCGSGSNLDNIFDSGGSLVAWIYPEGIGENNSGRIAQKNASGSLSDGWGFTMNTPGNEGLFFFRGFSSANGFWESPDGSISLDTWQHVAVVYNSSSTSNNPTIYIDGVSQTVTETNAPSGLDDSDASGDFFIGNREDFARTFDGQIAYISAYTKELNEIEIKELMHKPGSIVDSRVLYRTLWEQSGPDLSGTGNSCTATDMSDSSNGPPIML